jgi:hypothetical protein
MSIFDNPVFEYTEPDPTSGDPRNKSFENMQLELANLAGGSSSINRNEIIEHEMYLNKLNEIDDYISILYNDAIPSIENLASPGMSIFELIKTGVNSDNWGEIDELEANREYWVEQVENFYGMPLDEIRSMRIGQADTGYATPEDQEQSLLDKWYYYNPEMRDKLGIIDDITLRPVEMVKGLQRLDAARGLKDVFDFLLPSSDEMQDQESYPGDPVPVGPDESGAESRAVPYNEYQKGVVGLGMPGSPDITDIIKFLKDLK